jgi:glycosyltransferase A (GT-A) superfamily protein (DUF2064 family)
MTGDEQALPHPRGPLVIVLCKPVSSAECKTRLAADIGRRGASRVYRWSLTTAVRAASATGAAIRLSVHGRPADLAELAREHAPEADLVRQIGPTFAARQRHEIDRGVTDGFRPVLLLASDVAESPTPHLTWAMGAMKENQVAIVPSRDGGYSVLAATEPVPELDEVPMSTGSTFDALCERVRGQGRRLAVCPDPLADIDVAADLERVPRDVWAAGE